MSEDSGINEFSIDLPINPKDVFRILALRSVCETTGLFEKLVLSFNDICKGITTTDRLNPRCFRRKAFNYKHDGNNVEKTIREMTERQLCSSEKAFFKQEFDHIGHVIDYELPLDNKRDSAFGKVDLVSVTNEDLFLLEVKKVDSNEHPLRAMFEIFTFWKMLADSDGTFETFLKAYSSERNKNLSEKRVRLGLLLCGESGIYTALENCGGSDRPEFALYKRFLDSPIEMKVFAYDYDEAHISNVRDMTDGIKEKLGLK